jgi:hypothetical protein
MYVRPNFKTKKELKDALVEGKRVTVFEPGLGSAPKHGTVYLEGPHAPAAHTWYAEAQIIDGVVVRVK